MIVEYYTAVSEHGDSTPIVLDVPAPEGREFVVVRSVEVSVYSNTGRRKISPTSVTVERYDGSVNGADRDAATPLGEAFVIPTSGDNKKEVEFYRVYDPYGTVKKLGSLVDVGFRVVFSNKDRNSDYQRVQIGVVALTPDVLK